MSCVSHRDESKYYINSAANLCIILILLSSVITRSELNGNTEFEFNTHGRGKVDASNNYSTFTK